MTVQELIDKHPLLCSKSRSYGSWVGEGWVPILDELFTEFEHLGLEGDGLEIHQFKQKFGFLRVYTDFDHLHREDINELITQAAVKASKTCEFCGKPGELTSGKWIEVICDKCKISN